MQDYHSAPHSVESEQSVIGALLLDNSAWAKVANQLSADDFYRRDHQLIFAAAAELAVRNQPMDAVTLAEQLDRKGQLEEGGGLAYLATLTRETPSASNVCAYADRVLELSFIRKAQAIGKALQTARSADELYASEAEFVRLVSSRKLRASAAEDAGPCFLPWIELSQRQPPLRRWFMNEWLTTGATLLAGRGGIGKTSVAQAMASAMATNTPYLSTAGERAVVNLMWACEDDADELWRRQIQICAALGIDMQALEDMYYLESRFGAENTLFAPVMGRMQWTPAFDLLKEQVNDCGAEIVWLDNIGHTFAGNENERNAPTAFINGLVGMRPGLAVVLLGHPARNTGSEFAGSAAWENAVRTRWYFGDKLPDQGDDTAEPEDDVRYLCRRKANYTFRDYMRFKFKNGVFMPELPEGVSMAERYCGQNRNADVDLVVLNGFDKCIAAGITPTDGHTSSDYLPTRLVNMQLNAGCTKKEITTSMHRLLADGRLRRDKVGSYGNRSPRYGLVKP